MKLKKTISGGQTGADTGGLWAGRITGLETGGTAPKGWLTEDGPREEFLRSFGLVEHAVAGYPARTEKNVSDGTATIRFAVNFGTAGERCTLRFCQKHDRPVCSIDVLNPKPIDEVIEWLEQNDVEVLNVAGNREKTCPGLCKFVAGYLATVIWKMKGIEKGFSIPELIAHIKQLSESDVTSKIP
jgi:hypothetical protein